MPNGIEYTPNVQRTLLGTMAQAGEPSAIQLLGERQAGQIAETTPTQAFSLALMDLLKSYQQLGTRPFAEAEFRGREEMAGRILAPTPPELIGAPPGLQARVRAAQAGALEPQITGAREMRQTFAEQLQAFGSGIEAARSFARDWQLAEDKIRDDARNLIMDSFQMFGAGAFRDADLKEIERLEVRGGLPKGFIQSRQKYETLKEREIEETRRYREQQLSIDRERLAIDRLKAVAQEAKPLSGDAAKIYSIATTMIPEINQLKAAFEKNYKKNLRGIVFQTDRRLVKLVDNIADKVGRLRSGGAINKDEEARFKRQIASFLDIPFGKQGDAIAALDGIITEANSVAQSIRPQNFPGQSAQIPVREKATGVTGWLPEDEFDANIYNRL